MLKGLAHMFARYITGNVQPICDLLMAQAFLLPEAVYLLLPGRQLENGLPDQSLQLIVFCLVWRLYPMVCLGSRRYFGGKLQGDLFLQLVEQKVSGNGSKPGIEVIQIGQPGSFLPYAAENFLYGILCKERRAQVFERHIVYFAGIPAI